MYFKPKSQSLVLSIIGVWIIVLPFLGLPVVARKVLFVLTGITLLIIGYLTNKERKQNGDDS